MKLLVSVRDVAEARLAAEAGADFIDLKEPQAGALGALPLATIRAIVATLRASHPGRPVSATVGDFAPDAVAPVLARVRATAACGVDYVKVGLAPGAHALLDALAASVAVTAADPAGRAGPAIVPVFIADAGLDDALWDRALQQPFPALMLDTADKAGGSLLDRLAPAALQRFVERVQAGGRLCGLAGSLRADELPRLARLAPDFAGFRGAVCAGSRRDGLDAQRVQTLVRALQQLEPGHALRARAA